jgi:hypothetical protein
MLIISTETALNYIRCVRPAWAVRTCCKASEKMQKYKYFWLNNA